jgi:hypothetical protein
MTEENIIIKSNDDQKTINVDEPAFESALEESVETVEIADIQIVEVGVESAFASLGNPNDMAVHNNLHDRDAYDAHPISAITNLRTELNALNTVKTPQTLYSDKNNIANYYAWNDGAYDEYGYFVSLVPHTTTIKICEGSDIFGITVAGAGFIGNQNASVPRDNTYALVVTSGLVDVRCESTVEVGHYVISNANGVATKTNSCSGYKVIAIENKNGVNYASISLGVQACTVDLIDKNLQNLDDRIDDAETNIFAAINMANQAYSKATSAEGSASASKDDVEEALKEILGFGETLDEMEKTVVSSNIVSAQAKAIAESAATSAESMRNEAVAKANEALTGTSELRRAFEAKAVEIDTELDNTMLELQATKEGFNETINDLKLDTEGQLADFKKEVSENYATTTQLAAVKTETSDAIAAVKQEVSDTYATIETVAAFQTETSEAIAGFKQEVADEYATQEMLTAYKNDTSEALSLYKTEVAENYATQEMVSTVETDTTKALTDYKQEVSNTYATQEMVTKLETDTSKALTDYKQEVGDTYATQESLTTLKTDTANAIAASEEKATTTYASKNDLTSFESETNIAMARIEQKADANGAYIQSTVSNMDKYSVGPYSQAYGFTLEQAASVLEEGMIYVPTKTKTAEDAETYSYTDANGNAQTYTRSFDQGYLYKWGKLTDYPYGWITVDKNYEEATEINTSARAVYFTTNEPEVSGNFGYWYTDGDAITGTTGTYEPYTLYKWESYVDENDTMQYHWVAVATLAGNSSNRAVSQIRQDANSIETAVTTLDGKYAGTKTWVDENSSNIQNVVQWKNNVESDVSSIATIKQTANEAGASIAQVVEAVGENGQVNAASIIASVNKDTSGVTIKADHIQLDGLVSFVKDEVKAVQDASVYSVKIEYALSDSETTEPAETEWQTTAPEHEDGKYMWQRTTVTKGNGDTVSTATCIQGAKGEDGTDGADGEDGSPGGSGADGAPGATVKSVTKQFYLSTSPEALEGGEWSDKPAAWTKDSYMWTREQYTLTDETAVYSDPVLDNTFTTISGWCNSTEMTLIDGANIATGTLTAEHVNVNDLNAFSATIGGFKISDDSLYNTKTAYDDETSGVYLGTDGIGLGKGTFYVNDIGEMTATSGEIGGFTIDGNRLYTLTGAQFSGISGINGEASVHLINSNHHSLVSKNAYSSIRFFAGASTLDNLGTSKFMVLNDGSLYASAAKITGDITATSGTFSNCTIDDTCNIYGTLKANTIASHNGNYGSGRIEFLNDDLLSEYSFLFENNTGTVGLTIGTSGENMQPSVILHGNNGNISLSSDGFNIYNGDYSAWNIGTYSVKAKNYGVTAGSFEFVGRTDVSAANSYYINVNNYNNVAYNYRVKSNLVAYTLTSTTLPMIIECANENNVSKYLVRYQGYQDKRGGIMYNADNDCFRFYVENCALWITGSGTNRLDGTWKLNSAEIQTSDRNAKNNIQNIPDAYEILFDNLQSKIFKYNDGTSDRYHTGFEAQGVDEARQKANISRQDFAAVCIDNEGTEKEEWGLRYDEFISLNTWQIQKLKARVAELEERLAKLEK